MVSSFEYDLFQSSSLKSLLGRSSSGFLALGSAGTRGSSSSSSFSTAFLALGALGAAAASTFGLSALGFSALGGAVAAVSMYWISGKMEASFEFLVTLVRGRHQRDVCG